MRSLNSSFFLFSCFCAVFRSFSFFSAMSHNPMFSRSASARSFWVSSSLILISCFSFSSAALFCFSVLSSDSRLDILSFFFFFSVLSCCFSVPSLSRIDFIVLSLSCSCLLRSLICFWFSSLISFSSCGAFEFFCCSVDSCCVSCVQSLSRFFRLSSFSWIFL